MKTTSISRFGAALVFGALASFGSIALADTIVTSSGTISEFGPEALVIRTETSAPPIRYVVNKEVTYVDDTGAPVAVDVVKSGLPVSVDYVKDGDRMVVRKVIVHRHVEHTAPVVEEHRTVTTAPVIEEHKTTTTTTTTK